MQRENFSKDGRGTPPTTPQSLIDELEDAVNKSDMRRRATTLRRLTDLFIVNGSGFSEQQIAMFDEVMSRLVIAIDSSARAEFGDLIAKHPNAPPRTSRVLALDDEIKVAGPILSHSRQLDDATLIEGAKTKSYNHLYAISQRELIGEAVTDVLVERGNEEVVRSTAANPGAQFSEYGCSTLATRAQGDGELALRVWLRPDIPRQHLLCLLQPPRRTCRSSLRARIARRSNSTVTWLRRPKANSRRRCVKPLQAMRRPANTSSFCTVRAS